MIEWFATLDSTMLEARRNPTLGRVIVADEQTAGMGRMGRTWHSPPSEGLYLSLVMRPSPLLTLALGLAVRDVIGERTDLRWPNDVLLSERKVAGILAQTEGEVVIVGIGINVSQRSFPDDLDTSATSIALEGVVTSREQLLSALVPAVERFAALHSEEIRHRFEQASSYARGRRVRAGDREGVTCGLDAQGFLRLREDSGTETIVLAGGVRPI